MRIHSTPALIQPRVSNRQYQGLTIPQLARWVRTEIAQTEAGAYSVKLWLDVTPHEADASGAGVGARLPARDFPTRRIPLLADNTAAVDAQTGALRYQLMQEPAGQEPGTVLNYQTGQAEPLLPAPLGVSAWLRFVEEHADALDLQGDFFAYVSENVPTLIADLVRQHITAADALGRFA